MMRGWQRVALGVVCGWCGIAQALGEGRFATVKAVWTPTAPQIDGRLDELWLDRPLPYDLGDFDGTTNHLIVENFLTQVRLLWDREYLYVAVVGRDTGVIATLTGRDAPVYNEEMAEVVLRFPGSRYHYEVAVSPLGVVYDCRVYWDETAAPVVDVEWDCDDLQSAATVVALADGTVAWVIELAIPWRNFGFEPEPGAVWLGNVLRYERIAESTGLRGAMRYQPDDFLPMCLFPTHIQGWPGGISSLGRLELSDEAF